MGAECQPIDVSGIEVNAESLLLTFADDAKIHGVVNEEDRAAIKNDLALAW